LSSGGSSSISNKMITAGSGRSLASGRALPCGATHSRWGEIAGWWGSGGLSRSFFYLHASATRSSTLKAVLLEERVSNGSSTKRARKMEAQLIELDAQRTQATADEAKARDLVLLKLPSKAAAASK
jgi:hypothetical protein